MLCTVDTVIIGGGAMGSATAWQLARRGRDVLLLERFGPGHTNGASHGASRNFNVAYADETHLGMLVEALPLWRELEAETGESLLDLTGIANHGPNPEFARVADAQTRAGIANEFLTVDEAQGRWPGIRFDTTVLFNADAGRLNADRSVAALQTSAARAGATVHHNTRVLEVTILGPTEVRVRFDSGDGEQVVTANNVVLTAGAWTEKLFSPLAADLGVTLPTLTVTQEQPAHFAVRDEGIDWPGFNHSPGTGVGPGAGAGPAAIAGAGDDYRYWYSGIYGMFTPGQGVKAGWHGVGPQLDPDERTFQPEPVQLAALQQYARDWLPGVDADDFTAISCTYTTTVDSAFVLDRVGPVVVGAGFSGHGFKFTPVIGRILADLVDESRPAPELFSLTRQR